MENEFVTYKDRKYYVKDNTLDLSDLKIDDIDEIKEMESLTNLQELYLSSNQITEIKGLKVLSRIKRLSISNNQLSDMKGVEGLTNLEYLNIGGNQISEIEGLQNLVKLEELRLGGNQIEEIKGLENLKNLRKLCLGYNRITELKGLGNLTKLKELYLDENPIREDEWHRAFIRAVHAHWRDEYEFTRNAQSIVRYCRNKKEGRIPFVTVHGKNYYAYDYCDRPYIFDDGDIYSDHLATFDFRIDLSGLGITDITEIEGLDNCRNLKKLNLKKNQIK